jgi:hypothetical protein
MNDQFLHDLRRAPPPAFAHRLRASLKAGDEEPRSRRLLAGSRRFLPLAASVALVSLAFAFPSVRAGAQAFLDIFRISSVVAVTTDTTPLRDLVQRGFDFESLLGGAIEQLTPSSDPVTVDSVAAAAAAAGFDVLEPAWRPVGLELSQIQVKGEEAARLTLSLENLELVLDALGIDDLTVPQGFDGQQVTVRIPATVGLDYGERGGPRATFLQARSPEIAVPAGFDLPAIAEIALRIAGVDPEQAYDLAWTIDWRSTFIVPVPAGEAAFDKVDIGGKQGVAIEPAGGRGALLLWADGTRVFALTGNLERDELLDMAQSAQ